MTKITDSDALSIRRRLAAKEPASAIAKDFGVSAVAIRNIGRGKTHKSAGGPIIAFSRAQRGDRNGRAKLSDADVDRIRKLSDAGEETQAGLARIYGVSRSLVSLLCGQRRRGKPATAPDDSFLAVNLQNGRPPRGSTAESELVEQVFRYYRDAGYPTRRISQERIRQQFDQLVASPSVIDGYRVTSLTTALKLANGFHPHLDHVRCNGSRTPPEVFGDDDLFRKAIRKHIRYGTRLTPQGIRYAVYNYGGVQGASNFRPTAAKSIIELLGGGRVLDPCMGFGGRLLGALAAGSDYVGVDPTPKTVVGNRRLVQALSGVGVDTTGVTLVQGCAEDVLGVQRFGRFNVVLTSPPYFDVEVYDSGPDQSIARYPTFGEWRKGFLYEMVRRASEDLMPYGLMAVNVNDELARHVIDVAHICGLRHVGVLDYELYVRQFKQSGQGRYRSEPVILLRRVR